MRRYFRTRRAYAPRFWPILLLTCGVAVGLVEALDWHGWTAGLVGGLAGCTAAQVRWAIWKHRHPVITHDQYVSDLRRAARWN